MRYIANRSSGKQGFAIAAAAAAAGATVTLVSGPVNLPDPAGVTVARVESARDMLARVEATLPVDIAIFAAAVADWRVANAGEQKIKKTAGGLPSLTFAENPDILATISKLRDNRPGLVIGLPPRPNTCSTTPAPSSSARAATGWSPTTCRPPVA